MKLAAIGFSDTATTEIYTLSLHDALPISAAGPGDVDPGVEGVGQQVGERVADVGVPAVAPVQDGGALDRKSTRLNSSHVSISYAVFCLKKNNHLHVANVLGINTAKPFAKL